MRYYSTQELKPGQILAKTLFGTDGRILIKANTPLTPFLIQKLTILGFAGTYVLDEGETEMALKMAIKESRISKTLIWTNASTPPTKSCRNS